MKPWSAFLRDVRPHAPSTPEPMLEHQVLRAAQRFCDETRAWVVVLDPTFTYEGQLNYDLELERNTELVRLESATLNGLDYEVSRPGKPARGSYVFTPDGRTIEFSQSVGADLPLVVTAAVRPGEGAEGIDDILFSRYLSVIALGAAAGATGDASKLGEFESRMDQIKTRLWRGNAATRPRTRAQLL